MKLKKVGPRGEREGAHSKFYYVDPPLHAVKRQDSQTFERHGWGKREGGLSVGDLFEQIIAGIFSILNFKLNIVFEWGFEKINNIRF